jgi:hypothetical protein
MTDAVFVVVQRKLGMIARALECARNQAVPDSNVEQLGASVGVGQIIAYCDSFIGHLQHWIIVAVVSLVDGSTSSRSREVGLKTRARAVS